MAKLEAALARLSRQPQRSDLAPSRSPEQRFRAVDTAQSASAAAAAADQKQAQEQAQEQEQGIVVSAGMVALGCVCGLAARSSVVCDGAQDRRDDVMGRVGSVVVV